MNKLMNIRVVALGASAIFLSSAVFAANPIVPGWYADPEIRVFDNRFWIYPTYSAGETTPDLPVTLTKSQQQQRAQPNIWSPFLKQTFLDAFSSSDLVNWTRHERVLDIKEVSWAAYAVWAPSTIFANGKYYLFFSANNILNDNQPGGIGVAVSDTPA
ncbi:MAG TPA: family 43 glycosylhydrolase, partial [Cellvibrio sp.]